jgi:hypothetical protein
MIEPLVTLDEANLHLRRDSSDDDSDVELKIMAASEAVAEYLRPWGSVWIQAEDSNGAPLWDSAGYEIPATDSAGEKIGVKNTVKQAVLLLLGEFYKSREGEATGLESVSSFGTLPRSVVMLLYRLRSPVIA